MSDPHEDTPENRIKLAKCIVESMPASQHSEAINRLLVQWQSLDTLWQADLEDWRDEMSEFDEEAYNDLYLEEVEHGDRWSESTLADYFYGSLAAISDRLAEEEKK